MVNTYVKGDNLCNSPITVSDNIVYTQPISYKISHNLSVTIIILPKSMHINVIFLNVTKLKVTATGRKKLQKKNRI